MIKITSADDKEKFVRFVLACKDLITKPIGACMGEGVKRHSVNSPVEAEAVFDELISFYHGSFIAEEYITQHSSIAKMHPQSVNTIRATTIRFDNRTQIIHPFIRFGQGESVVDKAVPEELFA